MRIQYSSIRIITCQVFRKKQVFFLDNAGAALKLTVLGVNNAAYANTSYGFIVAKTAIRVQGSANKLLTMRPAQGIDIY